MQPSAFLLLRHKYVKLTAAFADSVGSGDDHLPTQLKNWVETLSASSALLYLVD